MARPASIALGGFYPTPQHLLPSIAGLVTFDATEKHILLDPVAGEGDAILGLRDRWWPEEARFFRTDTLACEMEPSRAAALLKKLDLRRGDQFHCADAFTLSWDEEDAGASLLFLNPPYDTDPDYGRLEARFLDRFTSALAPGGALVLVVPVAALAACARHLARHFAGVRAWRFPEPDFAAYRQVVVTGRRSPVELTDQQQAPRVESWGLYPARLPELPERLADPIRVPRGTYQLNLVRSPFDLLGALAQNRPWAGLPVGVTHSVAELVGSTYPTAMPPKPAHQALALVSGHFNGFRLEPDDPADPAILLKGALVKELVPVDEREDADGEVTSVVAVQQPRLRMAALRLDTVEFFEPTAGAAPSGNADIRACNTADLLVRYGGALARLMGQQFPALHDPRREEDQFALPALPRAPFTVQAHAVRAALKLLAKGENVKLVAEVGTGKTTAALYVWAALHPRYREQTVRELAQLGLDGARLPRVRRMLVICPPHLVSTWEEEIRGSCTCHLPALAGGRCTRCGGAPGCAPWAKVRAVRTIEDLRDAEAEIFILSREAAKLGHGYAGVAGYPTSNEGGKEERPARRSLAGCCPRCAAPLRATAEEAARQRLTCRAVTREPGDLWARICEDLAAAALPLTSAVDRDDVATAMSRRHPVLQRAAHRAEGAGRLDLDRLREILGLGAPRAMTGRVSVLDHLEAWLADPDTAKHREAALHAVGELARVAGAELVIAERLEALRDRGGLDSQSRVLLDQLAGTLRFYAAPGGQEWATANRASLLSIALGRLVGVARWETRPEYKLSRARRRVREDDPEAERPAPEVCGEPLYQAVPTPRRYPIAKYIARRMKRRFQLLVLDEVHEYNNQGTAQQIAAHRLAGLGIPTLALTGSIMGGYASSLFANFWALDARFRERFGRDDQPAFVKTYGYQKFLLTPPADGRGEDEPVDRGAVTDRREDWGRRAVGEMPGVLPIFLLTDVLPTGVVVHQDDLDHELPPMIEEPVHLQAETAEDDEMLAAYRSVQAILMDQIRADLYTPLSGKLWGAMCECPSYLDRCTADLAPFVLSYPEKSGGGVVVEGPAFPAAYRTPKERALLAFVRGELAEGRRVIVFLRHVNSGLPERLVRILREDGAAERVAYLSATKVSAGKRKEWLDREVVAKGCQVLVVNPNSVRTGLNNLVHFCSAWWHQIDYSAFCYRQANGRLKRIGQTRPVRVRFPYYPGTAQEVAARLVAEKVTASLRVDGLDVYSALESAGIGSEADQAARSAMAMGRAIYERLRAAEEKGAC